jgi:hypothetical protein
MSKRASQAFRPNVERSEDRVLTTVMAGAAPVRAAAAQFRLHFNYNSGGNFLQRIAAARGESDVASALGRRRGWHGPRGGPNVPNGPIGSTADFINWGVITIINTTSSTVTFAAAASTYNGGRFQNFTLRPGARQAYYAAFGGPFNSAPSFFVTFDTIRHYNTLQIDDMNVVNQSPRWYPSTGTEGRPYAIVGTVSGYNLVPMA